MAQGRPWDGVAGVDASRQEAAQREMQQFALHQMFLENQQKQANLDRYTQETPSYLQSRRFEGARDQARMPYVGTYAQGEAGVARQNIAKGDEAVQTNPGRINATNAQNTIRELESTARALELAASTGTLGAQGGYENWYKTLSPQAQAHFGPSYTPDTPNKIRAISKWLMETPQYRGELAKQREHDEATSDRTFLSNTQNNDAALARTELTNRNRLDVAVANQSRTPENTDRQKARLRRELAADPTNTDKMDEYQSVLEDQWTQMLQRDPGIMLLRVRMLTSEDPKIQKQAKAQYEQIRRTFFAEKGIYMGGPQAGTVRSHPQLGIITWQPGFGRDPTNPNHWQKKAK